MDWNGKKIGLAVTGSFCTINSVYDYIKELVNAGAEVYPIISFNVATLDTRFNNAAERIKSLKELTGHEVIMTIPDAEPVGPKYGLDALVIAPCTGNTAAKLANGITDTPVTMAAKAHLRNGKPLILSIATNDALGINMKNLAILSATKNIFFVPYGQDNYTAKPNSMISDLKLMIPTIEAALEKKQLQPIIIKY